MYGDKELNRLDIKNRTPTSQDIESTIIDKLRCFWAQADAWIVLDQVSEPDCGVITKRVRDEVASLASRDGNKFVLADSRVRIDQFRNVCVKPNRQELKRCSLNLSGFTTAFNAQSQERIPEPLHDLVPAVMALSAQTGKNIFTTDGPNGVLLYRPISNEAKTVELLDHIKAIKVTGPIDTCGAGDSLSAGLTAAMSASTTPVEAVHFANLVASITIQQIGTTGIATPAQVILRWREIFES
jgi:sugar/nucleoside kinase (ribokinase family)